MRSESIPKMVSIVLVCGIGKLAADLTAVATSSRGVFCRIHDRAADNTFVEFAKNSFLLVLALIVNVHFWNSGFTYPSTLPFRTESSE